MEEGKRRASGVVVTRGPAPPRVRHFEVDSGPLRRGLAISRHLAVSTAPPAGGGRIDRGAMGGEGGPAQAAILQPDAAGQEGASLEAEGLEGFRRDHQPGYGD